MVNRKAELYNACVALGYVNGVTPGPVWPRGTISDWQAVYDRLLAAASPVNEERLNADLNAEHDIDFNQRATERTVFGQQMDTDEPNHKFIEYPLGSEENNFTEGNMDNIYAFIMDVVGHVWQYIHHLDPWIKVTIYNNDRNRKFGTRYVNTINDLADEIRAHMEQYIETYNGSLVFPALSANVLRIDFVYQVPGSIGMYKSIQAAAQKWYKPKLRTRKNCLFMSIYTALNWRKLPTLLWSHDYRIYNTKIWLCKLAIPNCIKKCPDASHLEFLAKKLDIVIKEYDNICELVQTYNPNGSVVVEIQIANNHAEPLIEWDLIRKYTPHLIADCEEEDTKEVTPITDIMYPINSVKPDAEYNTRIGAWDIETITEGGRLEVYLSGLVINTPGGRRWMSVYGLEDNLQRFSDTLYRNREILNGYVLYAHNGGRFDVNFLMRDVFTKPDCVWKLKTQKIVELNNSWINITIVSPEDGCEITFRDSLKLLPASLDALTKDFNVVHKKSKIEGIGSAELVQRADLDDPTKLAAIKHYHKLDCYGLLEVVEKLGRNIWEEFQVDITTCPTSASVAKKIFRTKYYNPMHTPIYNLPRSLDDELRKAYMGGRNECFRIGKIDEPVWYFDFTSLYPYAATKTLPYGKPEYVKNPTHEEVMRNRQGVIRCMVLGTKEMLRGVKPLHGHKSNGRMIFQYHSTWKEMYLMLPEVLYGIRLGYKYEYIEAWFFKAKAYMNTYMRDLFRMKNEATKNGKEAERQVSKIMINSAYGFWGFRQYERDNVVIQKRGSRSWVKTLTDGRLVNYGIHGDYRVMRVLQDNKCAANVAVAAAITSYARMNIHELIMDVESTGGSVYYCDTDSIMTNVDIAKHPSLGKKYMRDGIGNYLGGLKNEDSSGGHFDRMDIAGCKIYTLYKDGVPCKTGFKGMQRKKETHDSIAEYINRMLDGECVEQVMSTLCVNKNHYVRENDSFEIEPLEIVKSFAVRYTKGEVIEGIVHPFEN
jgi:hypothetical protein